jgi:D-alanine-D-alanine ligase-like ATP-grasp enzyme
MNVALLYNLNRGADSELEFDRPSTIDELHTALATKHSVARIECTTCLQDWIAELVQLSPHLVFSVAEGHVGSTREAFYPGLFEQLRLPHIGSDVTAMLIAQNKAMSKDYVSRTGVLTPQWILCRSAEDVPKDPQLRYPMLVKPNSEGSSLGISSASIVRGRDDLISRVRFVTTRFRDAAIVEEFVDGVDISVSYVEGLGDEYFGPVAFDLQGSSMLDFDWKSQAFLNPHAVRDATHVSHAARLAAIESFRKVVESVAVRGYARGDFRAVGDDVYFLELNAQVEMSAGAEFAAPVIRAGVAYDELVCHIADVGARSFPRAVSAIGPIGVKGARHV